MRAERSKSDQALTKLSSKLNEIKLDLAGLVTKNDKLALRNEELTSENESL